MTNLNMIEDRYVSGRHAARLMDCPRERVTALAREGYISFRELPGRPPRFSLKDIVRLVEESTTPSKAPPRAS